MASRAAAAPAVAHGSSSRRRPAATQLLLVLALAAGAARSVAAVAPGAAPSSLSAAGPSCVEGFFNTTARHYAGDPECAYLVQAAFAAVSADQCPDGGGGTGSPLHRCLAASEATIAAWSAFLDRCPLANVLQQGSGRRGAYSCFPKLESVQAFEDYARSSGSGSRGVAASGAGVGRRRGGGASAALAAAAAAAALLL
ncbi:hypothetical protein HT031_004651 [Scenedesmus sp. PABB004]|nr:hypothetical protein HT031_004651 [Scenedesmus sp. PABB004]